MPKGRTAEVRGQDRQEAAAAGGALALPAAAALAAALSFSPAAAEPWHGRWIIDPKFCKQVGDTSDTMPLIIRERTMEWFVARCTYRGVTKKGDLIVIDARCSAEGSTGRTPIVLRMKDDKLVVQWDRGRAELMHRCP